MLPVKLKPIISFFLHLLRARFITDNLITDRRSFWGLPLHMSWLILLCPALPFMLTGRSRGNKVTRRVLSAMLGWPAGFNWANYKGSTRFGLKVAEIIIVSMHQAATLSPKSHVKPTEGATEMNEDVAEVII